MRKSLLLAVLIAALPFAMGANSITLVNAVGNPNNQPFKLLEDGTYTLNKTAKLIGIFGHAWEVNEAALTTKMDINPANGKWDVTLPVAPGTYDCFASMEVEEQLPGFPFPVRIKIQSNMKQGVKVK